MYKYKFKSREPFFTKERIGYKTNTVREIDLNEERFQELIAIMVNGFNDGEVVIEIMDLLGKNSFVRDVSDISVYNNLMIISWVHKGDENDLDV